MNESQKLRTILLWALLPIVCFTSAIGFTEWFASENSVQSSENYETMAWGKIIASSPDIIFQDVDSLKYYGWQKKVMMKKDSVMAADITHLFPESGARKVTIISKVSEFEVLNYNRTLYNGKIARQKNGDFILKVVENNECKIIPLGRFTGRLNLPPSHCIDKPKTTMNVLLIVTFLFCLLGFGFVLTSTKSTKDDIGWIHCVPPCAYILLLWCYGASEPKTDVHYYTIWIVSAWIASEIGLLSGVICRLYENKAVQSDNIFEHSKNKLKSHIFTIGEWKEVDGKDSLIINDDGTIYYSSPEKTSKLTFKISDNGCLIVLDAEDNVSIARYEVHPSSPQWSPVMKLSYNGKIFTKSGKSYKSEAEYYIKQNKENDTLTEVMKSLRMPKKNGSIGWMIVNAIALFFIGRGIPFFISRTVNNFDEIVNNFDEIIIVGCYWLVLFFALYCLIWNLSLILRRKRKEEVKRLFKLAYPKLQLPKLTEYIHAALKQPSLSIEEWEEQNKVK